MLNRKTASVAAVAALVCFGVVAGRYTVQAGPLDPPAGPVGPTGRTLEEVYDLLEIHATEATVIERPYEFFFHPLPTTNQPVEVVPGSGFLHKIVCFETKGISGHNTGQTARWQ